MFVVPPCINLRHDVLVYPFNCVGLSEAEEDADVEEIDLEGGDEQVIDISLEHEREDAVEKEVGDDACGQCKECDNIECVESNGEFPVGDENADSVDGHAAGPESNILSIGLHGSWLVQAIKNHEEDNNAMPQCIKDPLHKQPL